MGMKYRDPETGQFKDLKVKTSDTLPIGTQVAYGGSVPPTGWLICDGSAVSRTTYADLFAVIGTSYGEGDGSTTFNLPNKKGRVSAGYDSTNSKFNTIGKKLGEETHTHIINGTSLSIAQIPSHNHSGTTDWAGEHKHGLPYDQSPGSDLGGFQTGVMTVYKTTEFIDSSGSHQHTFTTSYTGSGEAHTHDINNVSNIQPTEVDNWIIKAFQSIGVVGKVVNTKTDSDNDTYSCNYINTQLINIIYPIGSIYMSVNNINPSTLFGGTWTSWGAGKVPVGVDESDIDFNTVEKTGGEKKHTLTAQELASHNHNGTTDWAGEHAHTFNGYAPDRMATGSSGYAFVANSQSHTDVIDASGSHQHTFTTNNTGGNQPHNNIQPYITCYMWKRTA